MRKLPVFKSKNTNICLYIDREYRRITGGQRCKSCVLAAPPHWEGGDLPMDLIIFAIRLAEALVSLIRTVIETKTAAPGKRRKADGRKR
jgi:hypothetical protein